MFKPGSTLWLLGHEMRLAWREAGADKARIFQLVALGIVFIVLFGFGFPIGYFLRDQQVQLTPLSILVVDLVLAVIFTLQLSQTLAAAAQALYVRADLDLLFSSPITPRRVLTVRFAGIALNASLFWLVWLVGLLVPIAITGTPEWLAAIPVVLASGLLAGGLGLLLTTLLFKLLGPRRTRTAAQVLAAVIGASIFLASQLPQFLSDNEKDRRWAFLDNLIAGETPVVLPPFVDLPARAAVGEPLPLALIVGGCLLVFLAINQMLGRRFARDAASAIGADGARPTAGRAGAFADGAFAATLRKELRLLLRDIVLFSQVLLRLLYLLPLAFVLLRNAGEGQSLLLPGGAAALAVMAGQLAASLAWITVSAEDAPDLLVASPAPMGVVNRAKLWAALTPTAILLAVPLVALTVLAPVTGLAAIAGCAASAWSASIISVWHQRPGRRADFRRKGNVHWLIAAAILVIGGLIGLATFLAAILQTWAIVPAVLAAALTLALRKSDAAILQTLRG
ncbi:MAG TPA: hypothetical protein VEA44_08925 [Caulobacter sp.]|nr:hypothetical protein [Caulobacter sp.]